MAISTIPLEPDCFYHIFNRAVGNEKLFRSNKHYFIFAKRIKKYILPVAEIYAYCQMPNHFHFILKIRSEEDLKIFFKTNLIGSHELEKKVSYQFSHCFNSFAQSINKEFDRKGSLFKCRFKRKRILTMDYMLKVIRYVHYNPVNHGFCSRPSEWEFSSYNEIIRNSPRSFVEKGKLLNWFENIQNFVYFHKTNEELEEIEK